LPWNVLILSGEEPMKIGIFIGSLRKDSFNRKIANALIDMASSTLQMSIIELGALPLFNQDEEANPPKAWVDFREQVKPLDGCLFVTAEYNRSIPAALKNAIDVGSRPYGQSVWDKKPAAVISSTLGTMGGFGANHHLRQSMVFLNMPCLQQPEVYLSQVDKLFDDKDQLKQETQMFLSQFLSTFEAWVKTNCKH
jgi:chromate reductase